jgi:hypothetical protein
MQGGCSTFRVVKPHESLQWSGVNSSDEILAALKAKRVSQAAIAKVLGVATKNANALYKPVAKTGKTRKLTYDEGRLLIAEFGLASVDVETAPPTLSLDVAKLVTQYLADRLGSQVAPDDPLIEDVARDIRAFARFANSSLQTDSPMHAEGFLEGLRFAGERQQ